MGLMQLIKKDKKSNKEIYERAFSSCSFDYTIMENKYNNKQDSVEEVSFLEAISNIPNLEINMQEVDFYA